MSACSVYWQCVLHVLLEVFLGTGSGTDGCLEVKARLIGAGGLLLESSPQTYPGGGLELVPVRHWVVLGRVLVCAR